MSDLALPSDFERALAEVETPEEAKALYDQLETLSQYARRYGVERDQQNDIAEAKLKTARKGGVLIPEHFPQGRPEKGDRKSTRLNSSHTVISYAVFCLKKK